MIMSSRQRPRTFEEFNEEVLRRDRTETADSESEITFFPDPDERDQWMSACLCGIGFGDSGMCEGVAPCACDTPTDVDDEIASPSAELV